MYSRTPAEFENLVGRAVNDHGLSLQNEHIYYDSNDDPIGILRDEKVIIPYGDFRNLDGINYRLSLVNILEIENIPHKEVLDKRKMRDLYPNIPLNDIMKNLSSKSPRIFGLKKRVEEMEKVDIQQI